MSEAPSLRAVISVDTVQSTPQLAANTPEAIARQQSVHAEVWGPSVTEHRGTIFKDTGDGILAHFASTSDALAAALAIQLAMQARNQPVPVMLRIGITHGQVTILPEGDLRGVPVNMADRIQNLAPPGGITITKAFRDDVQPWGKFTLDDWGPQSLKGFPDPVHLFRVRLPGDRYLPPPTPPETLPSARVAGLREESQHHPSQIASLGMTLRQSNEPDTAFTVHVTPAFSTLRDEYEDIGLEIGVSSAQLVLTCPTHRIVDHSPLGTSDREHDIISYTGNGWRIAAPAGSSFLLGPATSSGDSYIVAMQHNVADADPPPPESPNVTTRLEAARPDFVISALQAGNQKRLDKHRQAILEAKVFSVLIPPDDNPRRVILASTTSRGADEPA